MRQFLLLSLVLLFSLKITYCFASPRDTLSLHSAEFVQNSGQWAPNILFQTKLHGGTFFSEIDGFTVALINPDQLSAFVEAKLNHDIAVEPIMNAAAYKVSFVNSSPVVSVSGLDKFPFYHNYFVGSNAASWRSNVPVFHAVLYHSLYEGVDMRLSQRGDNLEYTFMVSPTADPSVIRWQYQGIKSLSTVDECLLIKTDVARVLEIKPFAYQLDINGDTLPVECQFLLQGNTVSFKVGHYAPYLPLVIDPVLVFSSFTGSTADNWGYSATYDSEGNLYGGGIAFGVGYPTTLGAYQVNYCAGSGGLCTDISISKFDAGGSFLHYSTYLGGSFVDIPHSLFVNDNNELYVFGTTGSSDFPVTANAFDTSFNGGPSVTLSTSLSFPQGSDVFVSKFSADGSQLLASTFVGGSGNDGINTATTLRKNYADDNRGEILVDDNSNAYVVTSTLSTDFPITALSYGTQADFFQNVCLFKLNQDLSQLIWSTYFGGSGSDAGYSMMLCNDGSLYICGGTTSSNLPVSNASYQHTYSGAVDGFVAHFSENGDQLLCCTYLGESAYDQAYLIKGDRADYPHVFGQTSSTGSHWITNAMYNVPGGGQFLTKLSPNLDSVVWSTAFGTGNGGPDISPTALSVDYCSNIYMSGWGSSSLNNFGGTAGLPITNDAFQATTDGSDYYFICLSDDVSQLVFASFFGGSDRYAQEHVDGGTSRFDKKGRIYQAVCAGCGGQSSFPTTNGAYSTTNGSSNCNLGVIKIDFGLPVVVADFDIPNTICAPFDLHFHNNSQIIDTLTSTYFWDFGDGTTSTLAEPTHLFTHTGLYRISLVVSDVGSCNYADSITKSLLVLSNTTDTLPTVSVCYGDFVQIGVTPNPSVSYDWMQDATLSNLSISNPIANPLESTYYTLVVSNPDCTDTLIQYVEVFFLQVNTSNDTTICFGDTVILNAFPDAASSSYNLVEWSITPDFQDPFNVNQLQLAVSPNNSTPYYVRLSGNGCTSVGSVTVNVKRVLISDLPDAVICFGDSVFLSVAHNGGDNCQYHWSVVGVGTFDTEHPHICPSASTTYSVTVTDAYGCSASGSGNVIRQIGTFQPPLTAWCELCEVWQFSPTTVYATNYGPDYLYHWSPAATVSDPDKPITQVTPPESTTYIITVTDDFGCSMTDSVYIKTDSLICGLPYIYIPNAFSPNYDGKNDVVYVRSEILRDFYFAIYNRWGEKVFETTNLEVGWDGTFKGKPCQQDVYDYYLKGTCLNEEVFEKKGNITLVR